MKNSITKKTAPLLALIALSSILYSKQLQAKGPGPKNLGAVELPVGSESVIWYSTWETATTEAKRSNRPIFFMAAAHQCGDISGTF